MKTKYTENKQNKRKNSFVNFFDKMAEIIENCQWFPMTEQMNIHTTERKSQIQTDTETL